MLLKWRPENRFEISLFFWRGLYGGISLIDSLITMWFNECRFEATPILEFIICWSLALRDEAR